MANDHSEMEHSHEHADGHTRVHTHEHTKSENLHILTVIFNYIYL